MMKGFLIEGVLLVGLLRIPLHAQLSYKEVEVTNGGMITGIVQLKGDVSNNEKMEITKDNAQCGSAKVSPRLEVGKNGGIKNAVVSLDSILEGKKLPILSKVLLNQYKCAYEPHVIIIPQGTLLEIVNSDKILHSVHGYAGTQSVFNIAQPIKGQRTTIKQAQLSKPGTIALTCDAGHPWMSGFVVVVPHPYYSVTDKNGNFRLDNIPPGKYIVKMWHEGITIVNKEMEKGKVKKYIFEEPYEVMKEVTVTANSTVPVDFQLSLR
ncbi:MAG: hypothetical protein HY033_07065 [Ignavibacteriae bacterium]|nr:hypothetical protein [Ignavibacteria bacterium]MBI3364653.1 hypothetical protein [Ignavibacteriota bacterium]